MALGDNYATLAELKSRMSITDTNDDTKLSEALAVASRGIEKFCRRQFNDAGSASTRLFYPTGRYLVITDDFHTSDGLILKTDDDDDGTFETTWATTEYQLEPLNGRAESGEATPYFKIRAIDGDVFPNLRRASVQVTARWGWAAVPAQVKESCLMVAEETFKMKDAPWGIAGMGEFGMVRVRDNPKITSMLTPFRRHAVRVR